MVTCTMPFGYLGDEWQSQVGSCANCWIPRAHASSIPPWHEALGAEACVSHTALFFSKPPLGLLVSMCAKEEQFLALLPFLSESHSTGMDQSHSFGLPTTSPASRCPSQGQQALLLHCLWKIPLNHPSVTPS